MNDALRWSPLLHSYLNMVNLFSVYYPHGEKRYPLTRPEYTAQFGHSQIHFNLCAQQIHYLTLSFSLSSSESHNITCNAYQLFVAELVSVYVLHQQQTLPHSFRLVVVSTFGQLWLNIRIRRTCFCIYRRCATTSPTFVVCFDCDIL